MDRVIFKTHRTDGERQPQHPGSIPLLPFGGADAVADIAAVLQQIGGEPEAEVEDADQAAVGRPDREVDFLRDIPVPVSCPQPGRKIRP